MIVVATEDFELYHEVVTELRDRGATFTTIEPDEAFPERTTVVITSDAERDDIVGALGETDVAAAVIAVDPSEARSGVERALQAVREDAGGRTVVGVDPGVKPGIAVLAGDTVVAAYQVPLTEAVDVVRSAVEDAVDPVVRIGDGARLQGARLIDALDDVRVELVDETGTTPHLGAGARNVGDILAAVNIARVEGEVVENRAIEPTAGELQAIRNRSRERSGGDRTIDESLARRVATGELTVDEAIEEHRKRDEE